MIYSEKEIAIRVVAAYKSEKEKAEKNKAGILWLNPIFSLRMMAIIELR